MVLYIDYVCSFLFLFCFLLLFLHSSSSSLISFVQGSFPCFYSTFSIQGFNKITINILLLPLYLGRNIKHYTIFRMNRKKRRIIRKGETTVQKTPTNKTVLERQQIYPKVGIYIFYKKQNYMIYLKQS